MPPLRVDLREVKRVVREYRPPGDSLRMLFDSYEDDLPADSFSRSLGLLVRLIRAREGTPS